MAKENPVPHLAFHLIGLAIAAGLVWLCYTVWQMTPKVTGPTIFQEFRIVGALLGMFVVLSVAQIVLKYVKSLARQ